MTRQRVDRYGVVLVASSTLTAQRLQRCVDHGPNTVVEIEVELSSSSSSSSSGGDGGDDGDDGGDDRGDGDADDDDGGADGDGGGSGGGGGEPINSAMRKTNSTIRPFITSVDVASFGKVPRPDDLIIKHDVLYTSSESAAGQHGRLQLHHTQYTGQLSFLSSPGRKMNYTHIH